MRTQTGFHYVEVLVATLILAIAIAPALNSMSSGMLAAVLPATDLVDRYALYGKLEEVLTQPISALDAAATAAGNRTNPSSYSDASDASNRRLVYLSRYDGDNADGDNNGFTGVDAGLIWLRVESANSGLALESLASTR